VLINLFEEHVAFFVINEPFLNKVINDGMLIIEEVIGGTTSLNGFLDPRKHLVE
jgi:hypothetical protein